MLAAGVLGLLSVGVLITCVVVSQREHARRAELRRQAALSAAEAQRATEQRAAAARAQEQQRALAEQSQRAASEQQELAVQQRAADEERAREEQVAAEQQAWQEQAAAEQRAWEEQVAQMQAAEQQRAAAAAQQYVLVEYNTGTVQVDSFMEAAVGNKLVGRWVRITNHTLHAISVSPMDFRLVVDSGAVFSASLVGAHYPLGDGELLPGGSMQGALVFEVPRTARRSGLRWVPMDPFPDYRVVVRNTQTGKQVTY